MAQGWTTEWLNSSDLFGPLRTAGARLPGAGWPEPELLTSLARDAGDIVNARGLRVRFVPQARKTGTFQDGFEPRAYLKGEVQTRPRDWHDLFNALVWMTFPAAKAQINARHCESLAMVEAGNRSALRDALTLFDEEGVVVLSHDAELLDLIRQFRWKELFWHRREEVRKRMHFFVFGHALYHKALDPFVGMTGKGVLIDAPSGFGDLPLDAQIARADRLLAAHVQDARRMRHGREFCPIPVLGVPGWWAGNSDESFYEMTGYFRPGRAGASVQAGFSSR